MSEQLKISIPIKDLCNDIIALFLVTEKLTQAKTCFVEQIYAYLHLMGQN